MGANVKRVALSPELAEDAATYASALDEIGGKDLAEQILDDDEDPGPKRALGKLKGAKRDEVRWIMGWFRGVADALSCDPLAVLRAGRAAVKFEDAA
jgi:hypothetical protein